MDINNMKNDLLNEERIRKLQLRRTQKRGSTLFWKNRFSVRPILITFTLLPGMTKSITKLFEEELSKIDLNLPLHLMLLLKYIIDNRDEPLNNKTLAEVRNVTHVAMSAQLKKLEHLGYINVVVDPEDKRSRRVLLTKKSEAFIESDPFAKLDEVQARIEKRVFRYLTKDEAAEFERLLRFVYEGATDPYDEFADDLDE